MNYSKLNNINRIIIIRILKILINNIDQEVKIK
jgi:hypothetical protein